MCSPGLEEPERTVCSENDAVFPSLLTLIQLFVCRIDPFIDRHGSLIPGGADRDRYGKLLSFINKASYKM